MAIAVVAPVEIPTTTSRGPQGIAARVPRPPSRWTMDVTEARALSHWSIGCGSRS